MISTETGVATPSAPRRALRSGLDWRRWDANVRNEPPGTWLRGSLVVRVIGSYLGAVLACPASRHVHPHWQRRETAGFASDDPRRQLL